MRPQLFPKLGIIMGLVICGIWGTTPGYGQESTSLYWQNGFYHDASAEVIYLFYYRTGLTWIGSKHFTKSLSLKAGYRSHDRVVLSSSQEDVKINWINFTTSPFISKQNEFLFKKYVDIPPRHGIQTFSTEENSLFYLNLTFTAGWTIPITKRLFYQPMVGVGMRYNDDRYVGELGNARIWYNEDFYDFQEAYYIVPVYQRGFDLHFSVENHLWYKFSDHFMLGGGMIWDFTFGFMSFGLGNYYHYGLTSLIKLN